VLRLCGDLSAVFGRTFLSQARMSREEEDLLRSVMEESVRAAALERWLFPSRPPPMHPKGVLSISL
jgi:hypothetical protein